MTAALERPMIPLAARLELHHHCRYSMLNWLPLPIMAYSAMTQVGRRVQTTGHVLTIRCLFRPPQQLLTRTYICGHHTRVHCFDDLHGDAVKEEIGNDARASKARLLYCISTRFFPVGDRASSGFSGSNATLANTPHAFATNHHHDQLYDLEMHASSSLRRYSHPS
ncbi:hypothetical protein CYLTODRAFT_223129 [Cylindrobasidium torrendii FP15055 ss-10]|uniref:Uncharacterized protein n=1 Tax=Cylindrobasidium torrendii FP15055 ss-10 TaxID=1314674 RepID=A0A0D7BHJ9_9AGAR|nr:hypothetical protein CYLTODRAFT_223129 [Cylindrobasidium torrendii FP15055 ss-10]